VRKSQARMLGAWDRWNWLHVGPLLGAGRARRDEGWWAIEVAERQQTRSWPTSRPVGSDPTSFFLWRVPDLTVEPAPVDHGHEHRSLQIDREVGLPGRSKLQAAIAGPSRARVPAPGGAALADARGRALRVATSCVGRDG
jgi:hypothetical protein